MRGWVPFALINADAEFQTLCAYLELVENHIAEQANSFGVQVDSAVAKLGLSDEDADYFYEAHSEEYDRLHAGYPSIARASVLAIACSRLESALTRICKDFESGSEVTVSTSWEDCKDKGVRRAASFLKLNFEIRLATHASWERLLAYFKVRDCFVHAGGNVNLMSSRQQDDARRAVARVQGVAKDDYGALSLHPEFFTPLFSTLREFWGALRNALRDNAVVGPVYWP